MATPLDIITGAAAAKAEQDALQKAADQYVSAAARMANQIRSHLAEQASLCERFGKKELDKKITPEVAAAMDEFQAILKPFLESVSAVPVPVLSADAKVAEPIEEPKAEV